MDLAVQQLVIIGIHTAAVLPQGVACVQRKRHSCTLDVKCPQGVAVATFSRKMHGYSRLEWRQLDENGLFSS